MVIMERKDKVCLSELERLAVETYKDGKIWSEAFNYAVDNYEKIIIPSGRYYADKSIIVKSDTEIIADEHAEIILIKGVKNLLLRNENVIDGSDKPIPENAVKDENISIIGGTWGEENDERQVDRVVELLTGIVARLRAMSPLDADHPDNEDEEGVCHVHG